MKNIIEYYYDIYPFNFSYKDNKYFFECYDSKYVFQKCDKVIYDTKELEKLENDLYENDVFVHQIVLNKNKEPITYVNKIPYILLKIYVNISVPIGLSEICYINNKTCCNKKVHSWTKLWEIKNDYIESQISEAGKKFPNLCKYINYYIGLSENAISYSKNINYKNVRVCLSHYRINSNQTLYDLYNPIQLYFDYIVRDISEYVKDIFFKNKNAYYVLNEFFNNNFLTYDEALLLYSRLLYPSYFYDLYDNIITDQEKESSIDFILNKSNDYEKFLVDLYYYLTNLYNRYFPKIDWIIKRSSN